MVYIIHLLTILNLLYIMIIMIEAKTWMIEKVPLALCFYFIRDAIFSWTLKKESIVTLSTCEVEFVSITSCICSAIQLKKNLLNEFNLPQKELIEIYVDNCYPKGSLNCILSLTLIYQVWSLLIFSYLFLVREKFSSRLSIEEFVMVNWNLKIQMLEVWRLWL